MIKIYGKSKPDIYPNVRIGGLCPHCNENSRYTLITTLLDSKVKSDQLQEVILSYSCDACLKPIPVRWNVYGFNNNGVTTIENPKEILIVKEAFDFEHIPSEIKQEIDEALDCLSVGAYNGFASLCRRTIQAICMNLGSGASDRVKKQVDEMIEASGLESEWKDLATQIMLSGHDGAHPHLPEVGLDRASVLLSLVQDLTYQLYTRPGKIKEAGSLRQIAINKGK